MTRDEAIKIEYVRLQSYVSELAASNIDNLIELGVLKVEEPKPEHVVKLSMHMGIDASQLEMALACYNLEIVKKSV